MTKMAQDNDGTVVPALKESATQVIDGTTSAQTTAYTVNSIVRVCAVGDVYLKWGADPTATANDLKLPDTHVEYFKVNAGEKIAVFSGTAHITTMV